MIVGNQTPKDLEVPDTNQKFIETLTIRKGEGLEYLKKCNAWKNAISK